VQRYAREIVAEIDDLLQADQFGSSFPTTIIVPKASGSEVAFRAIRVRYSSKSSALSTQFSLPFASDGVLLSLCNMGPLFASRHIVCIHDLNFVITPESYSRAFRLYYRVMLPLIARRAARVVTVSAFSAKMLNDFGVCPLEKITIIPNGHEHVRRWRPSLSPYRGAETPRRPFVFVIGSRARHKNVEMLLSIAPELDALGLDILVAGSSNRLFVNVGANDLPPNVRMLGFVTDDDLAALYRSALCLAFPSITEGFGVPIVEAFALRCPVVASDAASIPEVCGDAALLANPKSPGAWLAQIRRLRTEPGLADDLRAKGKQQAKRFSWRKSAQLYLDLIELVSLERHHGRGGC